MAAKPANDTVEYEAEDGHKRLAVGVVIMGGAIEGASDAAVLGTVEDAPWDGDPATPATVNAVLKFIGLQTKRTADSLDTSNG